MKPAVVGELGVARVIAGRLPAFLLVALAAGLLACAVVGFAVTQHADRRQRSEQHAALQAAVATLLPAVRDGAEGVGEFPIRPLAQRTNLDDLRLDIDPPTLPGRELQSLQDDKGRILGWFSWLPDRTLIMAMNGLWAAVGAIGIALAVCTSLAARRTQRLVRSLARSVAVTRKLTRQDAVTGLANHLVMLELLADALEHRRHDDVGFVLIDLDSFREANDVLGRSGGDAMLVTIANRIKTALPVGTLFGRFEDDEFAVILRGDDVGHAGVLADALRAAISQPIPMDQIWQITCAIGIAQAPCDGATAEDLVRRAGLALRAAKREGRGVARRFEPKIEIEHAERRYLLRELESALFQQALDVHYQPVVRAAGGAIIGVEALLRWHHPVRGAIAPAVFIPLAEASGLMPKLGEFTLRRALADAARWPDLTVAVNISPVQIRDRNLVELVAAVMAENAMAPARVVLEITEGILIDDPEQTQRRLAALRALGVRLALDDFGTGYSSLSYLQKFPFQQLKIDRAFVVSLGSSGDAGAIIQSIVTLGHALGMTILAEGVETDEQRVLLRLAGCDEMQGYLFAMPQPAAAIDAMLIGLAAGLPAAIRPRASAS